MTSTDLQQQVAAHARLLVQFFDEVRSTDPKALTPRTNAAALANHLLHGLEDLYQACGATTDVSGDNLSLTDPEEKRRIYRALVERIRNRVAQELPLGSVVAVITRGDSSLLQLPGLTGWHFPQNEDGVWAGFHPATGADALAHIRELHRNGAQYLLIPATSFWWLDFYEVLNEFLRLNYRLMVGDDDLMLFEMPRTERPVATFATIRYHHQVNLFTEFASALLPRDAVVAVITRGDEAILAMNGVSARHFPADPHGNYIGSPADDAEAIAALDRAMSHGAQFFAVPQPMRWWPASYPVFNERLTTVHDCIADRGEVGAIYQLNPISQSGTH